MSKSTLSSGWIQSIILCLNLIPAISFAGNAPHLHGDDTIPKPRLGFGGGIVNYSLFYRANIDTPYQEKNILQHTVNGHMNFTLADNFPVRLTWLGRKSNSIYFRDIYDVKAAFDGASFRSVIVSKFTKRLTETINQYRDSLSEKLYLSKLSELNDLTRKIENPFTKQRLIEMNEVIRIPAVSYDASLPDSIARRQSDSARAAASEFIARYETEKARLEKLRRTVDSLKEQYYHAVKQVEQVKHAISGKYQDWRSLKQLRSRVSEVTGNEVEIPQRYRWLLGVRNMGIGRNQLNYSELTAKNISVNGINFEYNSWYYFAVSAGLVDYRFRDFALRPQKRTPQYLYLFRLGVGQLERNFFIVSFFGGRKQLYPASGSKGAQPVAVTGVSAEAKWQIAGNSYMIAEAAQSASLLSNKNNNAFSVKLSSWIPKTKSRLEAQYKFAGANYQSFNSFQTNASSTAWFVKAEQNFLRKQLKLTASLRSSEFSNPYIVQTYSSNTLFKSLQATFRKRKWPMISIGYMPTSQLVKLDNQIAESRFHSLNASLSHTYKMGTIRAATTGVFNRFYNSGTDSGFVYFNAVNLILSQNFFFDGFNATINVMSTRNSNFQLDVLDGGVQFPFVKRISFGGGAKVNNMDHKVLRIGYYGSAQVRFFKKDMLYVSYEKGYLSGSGNTLLRNDFLTVSFSRSF